MATQPRQQEEYLYSPAVRAASGSTFGLGSNLAWDAYQRQIYNLANSAFTRQAQELLRRGNITEAETRILIDQRNLLVVDSRKRLSPMGRLYSEILKPSNRLPNYESLLIQKASNEAILTSVGKTRVVVNRLAVGMRVAGNGFVVLNIALSAVVIMQARPEDRARVAAKQGGALAGGAAGGWGGAWAGCAAGGVLLSPSLVVPIVGEIGTGGACLIGGIVGGLGGGALGGWLGGEAGGAAYDYVTTMRWQRP